MTKEQQTIVAQPSTDIWRQLPSTNIFNAPIQIQSSVPLPSFNSARISFSAPWKYRFDQGGLLLRLTKPGQKDKWLKTGVEFYNGSQFISTVGCDQSADWSVYPTTGEDTEFTVEARREGHELGTSLWVYRLIVDKEGKEVERVPLREVAWFLADQDGWDIAIGAYSARPADKDVTGGESLEFTWWNLVVA